MEKKTAKDGAKVTLMLTTAPPGFNFEAAADAIANAIISGNDLDETLREVNLTPEYFELLMDVGEMSGSPRAAVHFYAIVYDALKKMDGRRVAFRGVGCVYLIKENALGMVKIGSAIDYKKRLDGLKTACPQELTIVAVVERADYQILEKNLHREYIHKLHRGEWYKLTDVDIQEIVTKYQGRFL